MTINVKHLNERQIKRDALGLLEAYFHELVHFTLREVDRAEDRGR